MSPKERATAIMQTGIDPERRAIVNEQHLHTLTNRVIDFLPPRVAAELEQLITEAVVEAESEARATIGIAVPSPGSTIRNTGPNEN